MFVFVPCLRCTFSGALLRSKHLLQHPLLEHKLCEYETKYSYRLIATFSARGFPLFCIRNGREIYFREVFYKTC